MTEFVQTDKNMILHLIVAKRANEQITFDQSQKAEKAKTGPTKTCQKNSRIVLSIWIDFSSSFDVRMDEKHKNKHPKKGVKKKEQKQKTV